MERIRKKSWVMGTKDKIVRVKMKRTQTFKRMLPAPLDPTMLPPDYVARKVIIHAFLYYVLDAPVISDAEYDQFSRYVADNWDELSDDRKWALQSPDHVRSSGYYIRFSSAAVGAALNYHKYNTGEILETWPSSDEVWRHRKKDGCSYVTASCGKPRRVG